MYRLRLCVSNEADNPLGFFSRSVSFDQRLNDLFVRETIIHEVPGAMQDKAALLFESWCQHRSCCSQVKPSFVNSVASIAPVDRPKRDRAAASHVAYAWNGTISV